MRGYAVFLNPPSSPDSGSVHVVIAKTSQDNEWWISGEFKVKDCYRAVSLALDCNTTRGYKERMRKLKKIERAAKKAQELLTAAYEGTRHE